METVFQSIFVGVIVCLSPIVRLPLNEACMQTIPGDDLTTTTVTQTCTVGSTPGGTYSPAPGTIIPEGTSAVLVCDPGNNFVSSPAVVTTDCFNGVLTPTTACTPIVQCPSAVPLFDLSDTFVVNGFVFFTPSTTGPIPVGQTISVLCGMTNLQPFGHIIGNSVKFNFDNGQAACQNANNSPLFVAEEKFFLTCTTSGQYLASILFGFTPSGIPFSGIISTPEAITCQFSLVGGCPTGNQWTFRGSDSNGKTYAGLATVPGDIYTDMHNAQLIPDPLADNNDEALQWIGSTNWIYERTFQIDASLLNKPTLILVAEGLDTVADVLLNGQLVTSSSNQFRSVVVDVKSFVKAGKNTLTVQFQPPVTYAARQLDKYQAVYGHGLPPDCPPEVQHGQCHPHFLRKAQSSFSWDWGPSFPTVGIWKDIFIEPVDYCFFRKISAVPVQATAGAAWMVRAELFLNCAGQFDIKATINLPDLSISQSISTRSTTGAVVVSLNITIPSTANVQLWWPNGYGIQNLYAANASLTFPNGHSITSDTIQIGFRTIQLVQDLVDAKNPSKGRTFFFNINGVPVFLKGSNWIPASPFQSTIDETRLQFLFSSMVEAHMNAIRVWGGGVYESDRFYQIADQKGILIWQDAMFACALYPVDDAFLSNVRAEIQEQVNRLKYHPSIFIWAGNNENEVAIRTHWWQEKNFTEDAEAKDYVTLYNNTIRPIIRDEDFGSRPFVLSSPSNGVESEQEGGLAHNPGDPAYGDIHYYNYMSNGWQDSTYLIPRCASEFGFQSLPTRSTLAKAISTNQYDWDYFGRPFQDRQHHDGGTVQMLYEIFSHFDLPRCLGNQQGTGRSLNDVPNIADIRQLSQRNSSHFLDAVIFMTQMHQGIAYQAETEHYRRWRSDFNSDGLGRTMCALYWQLNDIWAAPTWASIDHGLQWKAAHYFARRFFAPLIVSMYVDEKTNTLQASIVSDLMTDVRNATVVIDQLSWTNGFTPVHTYQTNIDVHSLSAVHLPLSKESMKTGAHVSIFRARLFNATGKLIAPENVLLPDMLFLADPNTFGDIAVRSVAMGNDPGRVNIELSATAIVPLVWLEVDGVLGWFDENAFTMTNSTKTVVFHSWYGNATADQVRNALSINTLKSWYCIKPGSLSVAAHQGQSISSTVFPSFFLIALGLFMIKFVTS